MGQLLYKYEDLHSNPQHPSRKLSMGAHQLLTPVLWKGQIKEYRHADSKWDLVLGEQGGECKSHYNGSSYLPTWLHLELSEP